MSRCLAFALAMLVPLLCESIAPAQVLTRRTMTALKSAPVNEEQYRRTLENGPDTKLTAAIDITSKGNGVMRIANLKLKVVDEHDDGALYDRGWAHLEFADIDDDGWKDLVVTGIVNYTDDKTEEVYEREPFTFIYRYDPARGEFRRTYRRASFRLEDGPGSRGNGEAQKDAVLFPGHDEREFWHRAEERTKKTAAVYNQLGLPEFFALERFVRYRGQL